MTSPFITGYFLICLSLLHNEISCYTFYNSNHPLSLSNIFSKKLNYQISSYRERQLKTRFNANHDETNEKGFSARDSFNLLVLGDLHLEAENLITFNEAKSDCLSILQEMSLIPSPPDQHTKTNQSIKDIIDSISNKEAGELTTEELEMLLERKKQGPLMNCHMVSLGDLGRKDIRHEQGDPGTTKSFDEAKQFFDSFGIPYDVVTGNHDLEGLDEFNTDAENLQAWLDCFQKQNSYFCRVVGERTLLVGLSTVRFRDSPCSSHECHVDEEQLEWFRGVVESHKAEDGWKICIFSHAPIMVCSF